LHYWACLFALLLASPSHGFSFRFLGSSRFLVEGSEVLVLHEPLNWAASNALRWSIALVKKLQVEIIIAFTGLAKETLSRFDSCLYFSLALLF